MAKTGFRTVDDHLAAGSENERIPKDRPAPYELISHMAKLRARDNLEQAAGTKL